MGDLPKIYVTSGSFGTLNPDVFNRLNRIAEVVVKRGRHSGEELRKILAEYDGIVLGTDKITREVLTGDVRVRIIARHGVGVDNIDLQATTEKRIVVTYTPSANAESVAEHTIGLMLALSRRIVEAHMLMKSGGWSRFELIGFDLKDRTLGIIGLGSIGSRVAEIAKTFGMRILAYDPFVDRSKADRLGVELTSLEAVLKESDFVSIHASLTSETRGLIGERELRLMKPTAFLVNTARGAIVDENALVKALRENWIAGAALDVYSEEPLPREHPLRKMENTILTPHIASYTYEAIRKTDEMVLEALETFFSGGKPKWIANPEVWHLIELEKTKY
ncbi:MAG: phosphoglycerate dehydrogenase [Candidatus Bathyarchaeia archaeon]